MPWLRFTATYNYVAKHAVTIRYPAGYVGNVPTPCARLAVAAGMAVAIPTPTRDEASKWQQPPATAKAPGR